MISYKEKLNNLYLESKSTNSSILRTALELADEKEGYYKDIHNDLLEYTDWTSKFMRKWKIGKYISRNKWGTRRYKQINKFLQDALFKKRKIGVKDAAVHDEIETDDVNEPGQFVEPPKNHHDLRDELEKKTGGEEFSKYDYSRVARTEVARMKATYQLLAFKEAGLKKVIHKTRNDNRVGSDHAKLNNRVFDIDWLLSKAGEKVRIPNRPQCRCRYMPSTKGL